MRRVLVLGAVIAICAAIVFGVRAIPIKAPHSERLPPRETARQRAALDQAEVSAREPQILAEIAALGPEHPWAGHYYTEPEFTGTTVLIAPNAGALVYDWGCLGIYAVDWGTVSVRDGRVQLSLSGRKNGLRDPFHAEYKVEGSGSTRCLIPLPFDRFANALCLEDKWMEKVAAQSAQASRAVQPR